MKNTANAAVWLLAIAALSFWAGGHSAGDSPPGRNERTVLYYIDPMQPGFRSDKPGIAPCGMPLEPVYAEDGQGAGSAAMPLSLGAVRIDPARQQLIGVKTAIVEVAPMTYSLRLYGRIVPDETRLYRINASTDSWIRTLSDVTTGSLVRKNQILAEALAPAFYNAQVTYLVAMDNVDRIKQQLGGQLRHQQADLADNQIRLAVQALQNLGITDAQVEELANTRKARPYLQVRAPADGVVLNRGLTLNQWFRAGEEFYRIADLSRVWVYADVYENEARHLRPGMAVSVKHAQMGRTFPARVSEVLPLFDPISKTLKVRLDVENPDYELRPDMYVDVEIPMTLPPSLHVTADAVIDSGVQSVVYVDLGVGAFALRRVETGWKLGRRVEITGGLMPGEEVVVAGNFLIDSESRMRTAASGAEAWAPEVDWDPVAVATRDPVCGMQVDELKAETTGMYFKFAGVPYYFCSRDCMLRFVQDHKRYEVKTRPFTRHADAAVKPAMFPGQRKMMAPVEARQEMQQAAEAPPRQQQDSADPVPETDDLAGGNGPPKGEQDGASRWHGWGKFPGAEYLGLKDQASDPADRQPETRDSEETTVVEAGPENPPAHDAEMTPAEEDKPVPVGMGSMDADD